MPNYFKREQKNVQAPPLPEKKSNVAQQRVRKAKVGDIHASNSADAANQAYYSSYNVDQLLEEHDKHVQESAEKLRYEGRRGITIQAEESQNKDR